MDHSKPVPVILGNQKPVPVILGPDEYAALPKDVQKFYLMTENVKERSHVRLKDTHGHIFVKHDLYNHDPELDALWTSRDARLKGRYCKDGIAEAFAEFAKREGLSFFADAPLMK